MAKMRIFEIARSIQAKNKEIKSGDLVKLLNENGFAFFEISPDLKDGLIKLINKILPTYKYDFIFDINNFLRFLYLEK